MEEANIIGLFIGGIGGALIGHLFAAIFDVRSRDAPGVPSNGLSIGGGIIGALVLGYIGISI